MYLPQGAHIKTRDTLFELVTTESEFYCPHSDVGYRTKIHSLLYYYYYAFTITSGHAERRVDELVVT